MDKPTDQTVNQPMPDTLEKTVLAESGISPDTKVKRIKIGKPGLIIGVVVLLAIGIFVPALGSILIPFAIILGVVGFIISRTLKRKIALDQSLAGWAQQHNWKFAMNETLGRLEGRLFIEQPVVAQDLVVGTMQGVEFMLFNYNFMVNYQNNQIPYGFTVAKIDFPDTKPRFVCQSKRAIADNLTVQLKANDHLKGLSLEGNFNSYFSLEAEEGHETETLEIFDPTFMDMLMQQLPMYSFEMTPHSFIMYLPRGANNYSLAEYDQVFANFQTLETKFLPTLNRVTVESPQNNS